MAVYTDMFLNFLGRAPSAQESSYLDKLINQGYLTPGEIGFVIQGLPEFQQKRLEQQTTDLEGRMIRGEQGAIDQTVSRAVPQANAMFSRLGRQGSSGVEAMVAQQVGQRAQDLAQQRQQALLSFYGGGLSNISQMYTQLSQGFQNAGQQRMLLERQADLDKEMYFRQKSDYEDYLNQAGRGRLGKGIGQGYGAILGAGAGFALSGGNPLGALAGAGIGAGAGGNIGGLFR